MIKQDIELVIFDMDGTLLDFRSAENLAKHKISTELKSLKVDTIEYWKKFTLINKEMYRNMITGLSTTESYRIGRFLRTLEETIHEVNVSKYDLSRISKNFNEIYMRTVNTEIEMFKDAIIVLNTLEKKDIKLAILTNGPSDGQRKKIEKHRLNSQFEIIHISEETGFVKPNVDAFKNLVEESGTDISRTLMIGDSLEDDMEGAHKCDIQTILIDRDNNQTSYKDYKVNTLEDIDFSMIG